MKPEIDVCRLQMHQEVYLIRTKNQVVGGQNISVVGRQAKAVKEEDCTKPSCLQNFVPSSNHILFFFWVKIFENGLMSLLIYRQLYFLGIERGIWVLTSESFPHATHHYSSVDGFPYSICFNSFPNLHILCQLLCFSAGQAIR